VRCTQGASPTAKGDVDIGRESASKRAIEARRIDRKKLKDERRQERQAAAEAAPVDEAEMMARFQELNERRAAGDVSEERYEAQRREIFVALGLEQHVPADEPPDEDQAGE
jgi:hypothetical protein